MKGLIVSLVLVSLVVPLVGCGGPKMALLDMKATTDKVTKDDAYNKVTMVLIDKGFDIKIGNKDLGLVTTEYKKFGAAGDNPPFDFYLQIKTMVRELPGGKLRIILTPTVKEANRINVAAFTERQLVFFDEKKQKGYLNATNKVNLQGQLLFLNVAQGVAEMCGLGMEQLEQNVQLMPK